MRVPRKICKHTWTWATRIEQHKFNLSVAFARLDLQKITIRCWYIIDLIFSNCIVEDLVSSWILLKCIDSTIST